MFGSRNWRTKSRKERNYAPPLANSWLRHCLQIHFNTKIAVSVCAKEFTWSRSNAVIADYGETKIKWKTTALSEATEFTCGGTHKHVIGCIVGNFETKHKSPDSGQSIVFHALVIIIPVNNGELCYCQWYSL